MAQPKDFVVIGRETLENDVHTTLARDVPGGCLVTVRSMCVAHARGYYAESLTFVPGVRVIETKDGHALAPITPPSNKR